MYIWYNFRFFYTVFFLKYNREIPAAWLWYYYSFFKSENVKTIQFIGSISPACVYQGISIHFKTLLYSKRTYMYVYIGKLFLSGIRFCEEGGFLFLNKSLIKCYIIGQSFHCMWTQCKRVQFPCCLYSKFSSMCEFL